jgi:hypothetical protein
LRTVLLNLERLRRHYEIVVRTYDHVSLLDLSHALRIWVELKHPIVKLAPAFATTIAFKTGLPAKKVLKAARAHQYVFSYMPDGVITYAANGHLASGPDLLGDFCVGLSVKPAPDHVCLKQFSFVSASFPEPIHRALGAETVTRCNFQQWLGAEAVRINYPGEDAGLRLVTISREMIIKRVANTLDGSHPSAAAGGEADNKFDGPVHYLLRFSVGGLPLPYFILLKIAQDILSVAPKLLGVASS